MVLLPSILMFWTLIGNMSDSNNFEIIDPKINSSQVSDFFESRTRVASVEAWTSGDAQRGKVLARVDFGVEPYTIDGATANFVFKKNEARVDAFIHFNAVLTAPTKKFYGVRLYLPSEFQYGGYGKPLSFTGNALIFNSEKPYVLTCYSVTTAGHVDCIMDGSTSSWSGTGASGGDDVSSYVRVTISGFFYRNTAS
jgi:hypothetical protein